MSKVPVYDFYAEIEPTLPGRWIQRQRVMAEWLIICPHLPVSSMKVVEIGPGYGPLASYLNDQQQAYVGLEANAALAKKLMREKVSICQCITPPFPIQTASVGLVYASHVIEHLPEPLVVLEFVQEAQRVLQPGGLLYLAAPDYMAFGNEFWDVDYTHTFPVTQRRLTQMLDDCRFKILGFHFFSGFFRGPFGRVMSVMVRWLPKGLLLSIPRWGDLLYRNRLTFMRNVCVLARKPE